MNKNVYIAVVLNILPAILVAAIVLLWQRNPYWLYVPLVIYPVLLIFICYLSGDKIKLIRGKGSEYPDVSIGIIISMIASDVISKKYYTFSNKTLFLWCCVYICLILFIYVFFNFTQIKNDFSIIIGPFVLIFILSLSSVRIVNAVFDTSRPNAVTASVTEKRMSGRKSKSYYLKLVSFENDEDVYR